MNEKRPDWWPQNPYPKSIFPMPREDYSKIIKDPDKRSAVSGMLGREFWDIAERAIWHALRDEVELVWSDLLGTEDEKIAAFVTRLGLG